MGYHWVSVAKVSCGHQLQSVVICYDPNVPHELSISLTMYL